MTLSIVFKRALYLILVIVSILVNLYLLYINIEEIIERSQGHYTIFSQMSWLTNEQAEIYCGFLTIIFISLLAFLGRSLYQRNKKRVTIISILTIVLVAVIFFSEQFLYYKPV